MHRYILSTNNILTPLFENQCVEPWGMEVDDIEM